MIPMLDILKDRPAVPILRAATGERLVAVSRVLVDAGLRAVELTCTTPGYETAISLLREETDADVLVGAGTVRTAADAARAIEAGAQFLVNMAAEASVAEIAAAADIPYIPGALTATEISRAWALGVTAVKVSPVGCVGGPAYIRELVGPWPDIPLFPTGGTVLADIDAYLDAGAALVGFSTDLLGDSLSPAGDLEALSARASRLVAALEARSGLAVR